MAANLANLASESVSTIRKALAVAAIPATFSPVPDDTDISEATAGAEWMRKPLFPQGIQSAQVMSARNTAGLPLYEIVVVEQPRRSTKTTAVQATLLGRCLARPEAESPEMA